MIMDILEKIGDGLKWCVVVGFVLVYLLSCIVFQPFFCLVTVFLALDGIVGLMIFAVAANKWMVLADIAIFILCAVYWYFNNGFDGPMMWLISDAGGQSLVQPSWFYCWRAWWIGWISVYISVTALMAIAIFYAIILAVDYIKELIKNNKK